PLPQTLLVPFTVEDARAAGLGVERLRRSDLEAPFRGVRTLQCPQQLHVFRAALAVSRPGAFLSHIRAAIAYGVPLPSRFESRAVVDVAIAGPAHASRQRGIRSRRLTVAPHDVIDRFGLRITTPARTWCDLASVLSEEDLVAAGDFLLWRRDRQMTFAEVADAAARHRGRRFRPRLLVALPLLSDRADSRPESVIRVRVIRAGLPVPEVNPILKDDRGRFIAMPDLAFVKYRELIDYEGEVHLTAKQWAKDLKRVPRLEDNGWHSNRAGSEDLADSSELLARLERRLRAAGWTPA
ncbi:MAG: hypothetical protein LH471_02215, partial [Salinibacterium sp.]|nr:hypothetical protein [Salinibacterium sp.]